MRNFKILSIITLMITFAALSPKSLAMNIDSPDGAAHCKNNEPDVPYIVPTTATVHKGEPVANSGQS